MGVVAGVAEGGGVFAVDVLRASRWRKEKEGKKDVSERRSTRHAQKTAVVRRKLVFDADLAEAALGFGGAPACDHPTGTPAAAPRRPQWGKELPDLSSPEDSRSRTGALI
jgi:hypothetical protein